MSGRKKEKHIWCKMDIVDLSIVGISVVTEQGGKGINISAVKWALYLLYLATCRQRYQNKYMYIFYQLIVTLTACHSVVWHYK